MSKKSDITQIDHSAGKPRLLINIQEAFELFAKQIEKGQQLLQKRVNTEAEITTLSDDVDSWVAYNKQLLSNIFSNESESNDYYSKHRVSASVQYYSFGETNSYRNQQLLDGEHKKINRSISLLNSLKDRLELFDSPSDISDPLVKSSSASGETGILQTDVFIVHGHDEGLKQNVARLLEKLELNPIILHELPDKGRTVIEKLEQNSDAGFAVVLLTPDDFGGNNGHDPQPRARQNVILELGYFISKLGRERVCPIYSPGVELPSDYHGVLYIPLDAHDSWKFKLAKELQAVGFKVDLNKL